jgi:hypothetical protein
MSSQFHAPASLLPPKYSSTIGEEARWPQVGPDAAKRKLYVHTWNRIIASHFADSFIG